MSLFGKDGYMAAHEELVEEYLERNPSADWSEAYDATADNAINRQRDNIADAIDHEMDRRKELN